jgi:hypothetical protein
LNAEYTGRKQNELVLSIELRRQSDHVVVQAFDFITQSSGLLSGPIGIESSGRYKKGSDVEDVETFFGFVKTFSYLGRMKQRDSGISYPCQFSYDSSLEQQLKVEILKDDISLLGEMPMLQNREYLPRNGYLRL